jgi:hypothetical protein
MQFGTVLGYQRSNVYKALRGRGDVETHWQHPAHKTKWSFLFEVIDQAVALFEQNSVLTLQEAIDDREVAGAAHISTSTLHRYLEFEVITRKQTTDQTQERNSPEQKVARRDYTNWFLQNRHMTFVYIDEFGFNLSTQRRHGRAPAGQRAIQITPAQSGSNHSAVAAIQKGVGIVRHDDREGSFDVSVFEAFRQSVVAHYRDHQAPSLCFVMDNCRIRR